MSHLLRTDDLLQEASDVLRTAVPSQTAFTPTRLVREGEPWIAGGSRRRRTSASAQEGIASAAAAAAYELAPPTTQIYSNANFERRQNNSFLSFSTTLHQKSLRPKKRTFLPSEDFVDDGEDHREQLSAVASGSTQHVTSDARAVRAIHDAAMELANTHGSLRTAVTNLERIARQHECDIDAIQQSQAELSMQLERFSSVLNATMINRMFAKLVRSARVGQQQIAQGMFLRAKDKFLRLFFIKWYRRMIFSQTLKFLEKTNAMVLGKRFFRGWVQIGKVHRKSSLRRIRVNAFRQLALQAFRRWGVLTQFRSALRVKTGQLSSSTVFIMSKRAYRKWAEFVFVAKRRKLKHRASCLLLAATARGLIGLRWRSWEKLVLKRRQRRRDARTAARAARGAECIIAGAYWTKWLNAARTRRKISTLLWHLEQRNTLHGTASRYFKLWKQHRLRQWVARQVRANLQHLVEKAEEATAAAARAAETVAQLMTHQAALESHLLSLTEKKVSRELLKPEVFVLAGEVQARNPSQAPSTTPAYVIVSGANPSQRSQSAGSSPKESASSKFPRQKTGSPEFSRRELPPYDVSPPKRPMVASQGAAEPGIGRAPSPPQDSPPQQQNWVLSSAVAESETQRASVDHHDLSKWRNAEAHLRFDALVLLQQATGAAAAPSPRPMPILNQTDVTKARDRGCLWNPAVPFPVAARGPSVPSMRDLELLYSQQNQRVLADVAAPPAPSRRRDLLR
jgi:hypothetical protein